MCDIPSSPYSPLGLFLLIHSTDIIFPQHSTGRGGAGNTFPVRSRSLDPFPSAVDSRPLPGVATPKLQ